MPGTTAEPGYLTWGTASARLVRTMRVEAARSGHGGVLPAHILLAALDQPEMHHALRAVRCVPDVYALRAAVAASALAPGEYRDDLPLSGFGESLLEGIRVHHDGEPYELLYPLVMKAALSNQACRVLLTRTGSDPAFLSRLLDRID